MEKTIHIDERDVPFKSTGATPLRYKAQFGSDFFADLMKMEGAMSKKGTIDPEKLDFEVFYKMAWALAKTADKSIPDPESWLDTFDVFPIVEIVPELQDLIMSTLEGKKK